jgi:hypothetical protein
MRLLLVALMLVSGVLPSQGQARAETMLPKAYATTADWGRYLK